MLPVLFILWVLVYFFFWGPKGWIQQKGWPEIVTNTLEAEEHFWCDLLGFKKIVSDPSSFSCTGADGFNIAIRKARNEEDRDSWLRRIRMIRWRALPANKEIALYINVDEPELIRDSLQEQQVTTGTLEDPGYVNFGVHGCTVRSPSNVLICFYSDTDRASSPQYWQWTIHDKK